MKRSEMIDELLKILPPMSEIYDGKKWVTHYNVNLANKILSTLEQAGMTPPGWSVPGKVYYGNGAERKWEPENDCE